MRWIKECCEKLDNMTYNQYGALVERNRESKKPVSDFHAENQASMIAIREAVAKGDIDRVLDLKFREGYV